MSDLKTPESLKELPSAVIHNMIDLATAGFGVVVALAWTEVIKAIITNYIDPLLGKNGSLVSLLIYATVMTFLAVVVTMQLTRVQKRLTPKPRPAAPLAPPKTAPTEKS